MRLLPFVIITLLGCAAIQQTTPVTPFQEVCEVMDCSKVTQEPIVIKTNLVRDHMLNLVGYLRGVHYDGEKYVFVRAGMTPKVTREVTIHELAHFVGTTLGVDGKCEQEALARNVTYQITGAYDPAWVTMYNCSEDYLND